METKGTSIFLDVFRRADKNDDGAISWEEFVSFFADGVMGKEELEALFKQIDTHKTNNIDTGELCDYFSKHLGEFREIYGLVEDLNSKISSMLMSTSQTYHQAGTTDKFITRFLMREVIKQVTALQQPLEAASDHLDEQGKQEREDVTPVEASDVIQRQTQEIIPGRVVRRARRQISTASQGSGVEGTGSVNPVALGLQVDRLTQLLDRLEHNVNFGNFVDENLQAIEDDKLYMVQREMKVNADKKEDFRLKLRDYVENTQNRADCLSIAIRYYKDSGTFSIYEIWQSKVKYSSFTDEEEEFFERFKEYLDSIDPEFSIEFPGEWWKRD